MAIARVAGQTAQFSGITGTTAVSVTFPQNVVAGNAIMVFVRGDNNAAGTYPDDASVTDNLSNSYTKDKTVVTVDEHRIWIYSAKNLGTGGACTITFSSAGIGGAARRALGCMEYSGFTGGASLDQTNSSTGTASNNPSSGSVSTATAAELLFGVVADGFNGSPYTPGTNWSELGDDATARGQFQDQITTSTGTYISDETATNNVTWTAAIATYKASGGGPPLILTQPADKTVDYGNAADFFVSASSQTGAVLSYQWTENGTNLSTNASVTISPTAQTDQNAVLDVNVWDTNGTTNANDAVLRLNFNGGLYYLQEANTTDRYTIEDGSGFYLIESWTTSAAGGFQIPFFWGDLDGLARRFYGDRLN